MTENNHCKKYLLNAVEILKPVVSGWLHCCQRY